MAREDRPPVVLCPACNSMACTRLHKRCRFCGMHLYYVGEPIDVGEAGFVWDPDRAEWVNLDELGEPQVVTR
jgi:hypothetical protein